MNRNRRLGIFLNDEEWATLRAASAADVPMGQAIRRLALDQAAYLLRIGKQQRPKLPHEYPAHLAAEAGFAPPDAESSQIAGDYELDTSESQQTRWS